MYLPPCHRYSTWELPRSFQNGSTRTTEMTIKRKVVVRGVHGSRYGSSRRIIHQVKADQTLVDAFCLTEVPIDPSNTRSSAHVTLPSIQQHASPVDGFQRARAQIIQDAWATKHEKTHEIQDCKTRGTEYKCAHSHFSRSSGAVCHFKTKTNQAYPGTHANMKQDI